MATQPFVIVPSLAAIAVAYPQGKLIADRACPRVSVATESFRYTKYGLGDAFRTPDTRVGRKSAPNQLDWSGEELTTSTNDEGLDAPVPNKDIKAYDMAKAAGTGFVGNVDPLARATANVTQALQNRREKRTADLIFNPASYGDDNKVDLMASGQVQWSDYDNSDPLRQIMEALDSCVVRPNVAIWGRKTSTTLRMNPKICKAVFGNNTDAGVVPLQALADLLELDEILVGDAWIDTAKPGQPTSLVRCWGSHASFMYRNMQATVDGGVTFCYTAQWGDRVAGTILDSDVGMLGGVRVRVGESVKELATANDLGYFFENVVA